MGFWQFWRSTGPRPAGLEAEGIGRLRNLTDDEVEARLRDAMRGAGYAVLEGLQQGVGTDWILRRRGERTVLRRAHWRDQKVGAKQVRKLYEFTLEQGAAGCKLVTCGVITRGAEEFARGKSIELLDGATLLGTYPQLLNPSMAVARDQDLYSPFIPAPDAPRGAARLGPKVAPLCPRCRGTMALRRAGADAGNAAGVQYWACSNFPRCPGTRPG